MGFIGKRKRFVGIIVILVLAVLFCYWQNNDIVITRYEYSDSEVPDAFKGFRILQVSDLHNKRFGNNQAGLIRLVKKIQPDIILITGDLIDRYRTDVVAAMDFVRQAAVIAPVYYVTGNHEKSSAEYPELEKQLLESGVVIMDNHSVLLQKGEDSIALLGLEDPYFLPEAYRSEGVGDILKDILGGAEDRFKILLSHRPELIDLYASENINLVFSGHAHGGQFRLPFIGGLFAPDQGFFPKYTSGINGLKNTSMVVSRGLGNSVIPVRIFNRPELVVVTLEGKEEQKR
jgi:predicted MPP superfamily phosphohydrolase